LFAIRFVSNPLKHPARRPQTAPPLQDQVMSRRADQPSFEIAAPTAPPFQEEVM
jgi:hypothetical protein